MENNKIHEGIWIHDRNVAPLVQTIKQCPDCKIRITELHKKLGRRKTDNAIKAIEAIEDSVKEWLHGEWNFLKLCWGIHEGRKKLHYQLDSQIEIEQRGENSICIKFPHKNTD